MPASVGFLVIDAVDTQQLARFWCGMLGVEVIQVIADGQYVVLSPTTDGLTISFQAVPEDKNGKNRLHLDLAVTDLDAATAEAESLGGKWLEPGTTRDLGGYRWRAMADPEGNEFDIALLPPG
jgi:predicted enzyme related to lactoylglutathione lyase